MFKRLGRVASKGFIRLMILLFMIGAGLWVLTQIISLSGRTNVTQPVGGLASRFRTFATTGT